MFNRTNFLSASFIVFIAVVEMAASCQKSGSNLIPSNPNPKISGATAYRYHPGDTVIIRGVNLGKDITKIQVTIASEVLASVTDSMKVLAAADTTLSVLIPKDSALASYAGIPCEIFFQGSNQYQSSLSGTVNITVALAVPKGWFDTKVAIADASPIWLNAPPQMVFPSDSVGYLTSKYGTLKTEDGGFSWNWANIKDRSGCISVAAVDTGNVWQADVAYSGMSVSTDGFNSYQQVVLPVAVGGSLESVYMASPGQGLAMTNNGRVYSISGGYDTTNSIKLDYNSNAVNTGYYINWLAMSVIDVNNLIIVGTKVDTVAGQHSTVNVIVTKINGIYSEHAIPALITPNALVRLQLIDVQNGYAIDSQGGLFRYSNGSLTKLSQSATALCFTSSTTGYIGSGEQILQTSDGGQSWTPVFTGSYGGQIQSFATHNGKVWALDLVAAGNMSHLIRYNP